MPSGSVMIRFRKTQAGSPFNGAGAVSCRSSRDVLCRESGPPKEECRTPIGGHLYSCGRDRRTCTMRHLNPLCGSISSCVIAFVRFLLVCSLRIERLRRRPRPATQKMSKDVYRACRTCHQVGPDANNGIWSPLNGIIGRKAGTIAGFNNSDVNKEAGTKGLVWTRTICSSTLRILPPSCPATR